MKLNSLHINSQSVVVFKNYMRQLSDLLYANTLAEGKRVIVTTEIIDDDDDDSLKITKQAKNEFIEKAKQIGEFGNSEWVEQIINGLKQVGVQGCLPLADDDRPVSNREIRQLIGLLINLIKEDRGDNLLQLTSESHKKAAEPSQTVAQNARTSKSPWTPYNGPARRIRGRVRSTSERLPRVSYK